MDQKIKDACYVLSLKGYNYREIAEKTNVGYGTVQRVISSITKSRDYQFAVITMAQFLERFARASDYFELKKKELEDIEVDDNDQKIKIIALQTEIETKALSLAKQGQLVQAIQALKNGKIKLNELTGEINDSDKS